MIKLENLCKTYYTPEGEVRAVKDVSMDVPKGNICVLLGPSGCGKTTTLKMINRIISVTSGKIYLNGENTESYDEVSLRRKIGYVIQQIGLFPNLTIEENICIVPKLMKWEGTRMRERAIELLNLVSLEPKHYLKRYPRELSGGQQQRIGVIRALAVDPPVMLMDEPFGAIDPINREAIQDEFLKLQQTLKKTILFVSHDISEAVKMGDLIAIFDQGELVQFDTPDNILSHPTNDFVKGFVGEDRFLKRLALFKVEDAIDHMHTIFQNTSVTDALQLMQQYDYQRLVVLDDSQHQRPLGCVAKLDLTDTTAPLSRYLKPLLAPPIHIKQNLRVAVSTIYAHNVNWLTCVDGDGKLVGFISQQGIVRTMNVK